MPTNSIPKRTWRFFRAGGFDQVRLDAGVDLIAIDQLDQKLWVALACPTTGLQFDPKTLALIDTDKDGRVRAPELIAAVKWAGGLLKDPDTLLKGAPALPLAAINDATDEGRLILNSARTILAHLGKTGAQEITIEDTTDTARILAQTKFNGDGIVPVEAAGDDAARAVIADIIACLGPETDRSGKPGISQAKVDLFFTEAQAYSDWWAKTDADAAILAFGPATPAAAAAVKGVKSKIDDYFTRCQLAAFDPRAITALNREEKEYLGLGPKDLAITSSEIAGFPLAHIEAGRPLHLTDGLNPAWKAAMAALRENAVKTALGDVTSLTEADWADLLAKLGPFECWQAGKAGSLVEKLGLARVRELLASKARETLNGLIAQDKAEEPNITAIAAVDRLLRYHRDLYLLATNFVNFKDFYDRGDPAIFQAGKLFLDQRTCELCLTVEDASRHAAMAGLAGAYLAYCDCVRKGTAEKLQIVAAFTDGDSDNLMVGRNGIFYDRKGQDWDATITKIIENPISIRQAFWSPYKKFVRMIEEQIAKRAAAADKSAEDQLAQAATQVAQADKIAKPAPPLPKKIDVGTVAALGVAFGAIGTFAATLWASLLGIIRLGPLHIVGAFVGLILLISGPSLVMAYIKLRKRNLGPILDANGWAVNAKAKINVPFGSVLTQVAKLPPGAQRDLVDPYAEKRSLWPKLIGIGFALYIVCYLVYSALNGMGFIHEWTGGRIGEEKKRTTISDTSKPAAKPAAETPATNAPAAKP